MANKITQKELQYLKSSISQEQLMDLISLKARIDKRKSKLGKINESFEEQTSLSDTGFQNFYELLDEQDENIFKEVFGIFKNDTIGVSVQSKIFMLFKKFLQNADRYIVDRTE